MPGSTAAPSEEQTKAKVTESPAANGIFVRPVAVAGIFRPADDKPPALPEKRRFSALCGELRPSRGVSSDEFARRRQSFDTKTKEVPFSQALLKKTPRQNTPQSDSPLSSKPDLTNGSSHEDISCKESSSQVSTEKSVEKLNLKSELSLTTSNSSVSEKQTTAAKNLSEPGKSQIVPNTSGESSKFVDQLGAKSKNVNETNVVIDKFSSDSNTVKTTFKTVSNNKQENKNAVSDAVNTSSSDKSKSPKKVFGLIKRDSKCETTSQKIGNHFNVSESKSDLICTNVKAEFSKNESTDKILHSENINISDSSKFKVKVYGLSKSPIKRDVGKDENKEIQAIKSPESSSVNVASSNVTPNKVAETTVINKSPKIQINSKNSELKDVKGQSENSDSKPVQSEANTLYKTVDSKAKLQSSESNVTDSNNLTEVSSVTSSEASSKSSDSKVTTCVNKITEKVNEFQKAQSPPKDFRTVRRTSNVIAEKIQNIFSNISTPEKPPTLLPKKFKISDKCSSKDSVKTTDGKNIITGEIDQTVKQSNEKQTADSNKSEIKMPVESKSVIVETQNLSKLTNEVTAVTQPEVNTKSFEKVTNNEFKYKEQTPSAADHSSLKKENKLTSESSDVLQCCKVGESAITRGVAAKVPLEKAGSKIEHTESAVPSKALDKKNVNIEGKMPIKKQDQSSSDGTASLKTTNRDDRKSSDPTAPLKNSEEKSNKGTILKVESSDTSASLAGKNQKSVSSANSVCSSVDVKNNHNNRNAENSDAIKDNTTKSVDISLDKTSVFRKSESVSISKEVTVRNNEFHKDTEKSTISISNITSNNQISKIEVAKITPCTSTSVPSVNVLFRTKNSQSTATKEENRKKVIVESYSGTSSTPINSPKISDNKPNTCESVQEALNTVETVQKSLNSPKLSSKHSIVNLKKEELATVNLSTIDSSLGIDNNNNMPPNVAKATDKCFSVEDNENKVETVLSHEKTEISTPVASGTVTTKTSGNDDPCHIESDTRKSSTASAISETNSNVEKTEKNTVEVVDSLSVSAQDKTSEVDKSTTSDSKSGVVDLNDWNKRFQRAEPEPPRVPVRRRFLRESMPPSLPVRSHFGSLKRLDDSPSKFIARSPSQSCIPQRYSYTEMLSKVCSMGVLPFTEPLTPRSCSSSSSQVSELWSELSEEQATATHTSEMLESETTERMRLEKEVQELQVSKQAFF